ncbi:PH domain-containing protein [Dermatophilaceae bacterium Sec6.4]
MTQPPASSHYGHDLTKPDNAAPEKAVPENAVPDAIPTIADIPEDGVWRRLSPRMLLIHPVREVIRFLPALIAVVFAGRSGGQQWWGLVVTAVAIGSGIARWFTTRYRFTTSQVQLRSGLLRRSTVSAPADRVRSVDVTASILHRALGLAEVKIGTAAGEKEMKLDGLTSSEAAALRSDLLHHSAPVASSTGISAIGADNAASAPDHFGGVDLGTVDDETLYRLHASWLRFAPFSPSGLIAALAIFGLGSQLLQETGLDPSGSGVFQDTSNTLSSYGLAAAVVVGLLGLLVIVVLLSLIAYALAFFNFRLTRSRGGETFHVSRGLLTTRATSLEVRRLRGIEMHEPVPLRWASGARLRAITTGVKDEGTGMSALLTPPSPRLVVQQTAEQVLRAPGRLQARLRTHGPSAVRRRWTRAFSSSGILAAVLAGAAWWFGLWGLMVLPALVLVAAVPLARSRIAALGHDVDQRFVVGRAGALMRSTFVLERSGVVALTLRRSVFQRRAGVCSVLLATAAGSGSYEIIDVTDQRGDELADQVSGGLAGQFMVADSRVRPGPDQALP